MKLIPLLVFLGYIQLTFECNQPEIVIVNTDVGYSPVIECETDNSIPAYWTVQKDDKFECGDTSSQNPKLTCTIHNITEDYNNKKIVMKANSENNECPIAKNCTFIFKFPSANKYSSTSSSIVDVISLSSPIYIINKTTSLTSSNKNSDVQIKSSMQRSSVLIVSTSTTSTSTTSTSTTTPPATSQDQTDVVIIVAVVIILVLVITLLVVGSLLWIGICVRSSRRKAPSEPAVEDTFVIVVDSSEVKFRDIVVEELISKGVFTLTHQATMNGTDVTSKRLRVQDKGVDELTHEIAVLKQIKQLGNFKTAVPNFLASTHDPDPLCFVMERLPSTDLKHFLNSLFKGPTPEWYLERIRVDSCNSRSVDVKISQDLMNILIQVAEGEEYLSKNEIIHGNLSTRSILVGDKLTVKLTDFLPPLSGNDFISTGRQEQLQNMAPESIIDGSHTSQSEIWSFGILMHRLAMFESREPFAMVNTDELGLQIQNGMRPLSYPAHSKEFYCQILECLKLQPGDRPKFNQVIHTLLILKENSSQHLLFNISNKKKGYIDETGMVFLHPISSVKQKKQRRILGAHKDAECTSVSSGVCVDGHSSSPNRRNVHKFSRTISSLINSQRKSSEESALSEFEQLQLTQQTEITRRNPLAMT